MGLKQEHQKELYDWKRHGDKVGDLVWLHSTVVPHGFSQKLHDRALQDDEENFRHCILNSKL